MRILHTMVRVGNLERSIEFYTKVLGMRLLRNTEYPTGRFTNAFVGYQDERDGPVLELTYNWDTSAYDLGTGYGHIALEVDNAYEVCDKVRTLGGKVTREAGPTMIRLGMATADGFVKMLADATTDELLGVHIIGPSASDLIAEAAVAIEFKASSEDIARVCHPHPSLSEVLREAALAVDKRALNM